MCVSVCLLLRGLPLVRPVEAAVLIGAPNICIKISEVSFRGKTNFKRTAATRRTRDGHVRDGLAAGQAATEDT